MENKVSQFREMLNKKRAMETKNNHTNEAEISDLENQNEEDSLNPTSSDKDNSSFDENSIEFWQDKYQKAVEANEIQKNMYLQKMADFENMRKRLKKDQEEMVKYGNEKILTDIFPILDSLEMTLSHCQNKDDPISQGVQLTLKQFLQTLEKFSLKEISGEGELFNPHMQEAIGTESIETLNADHVTKVLRKGYMLGDRVLRAALVIVNQK